MTTFKLSTISALGISAAASLVCLHFSADSAQASFTCGSHMKTYRVISPNGALGGVRCVKPINAKGRDGNTLLFAWYGEGRWGNTNYRHVGSASVSPSSGRQINYADDVYGNGENTGGAFRQIALNPSPDYRTIRVSGDWNEIWTLAANNIVQDYSSQLGSLNSCGRNFHRYVVTDSNDRADHGAGIRCESRQSNVWYGEGNWNGVRYAHIGFLGYQGYGATDLCEPSRSRACGDFPIGSLKMFGSTRCVIPEKLRVQGAWNEVWTNNPNSKTCID
jgi:hypothetical protein